MQVIIVNLSYSFFFPFLLQYFEFISVKLSISLIGNVAIYSFLLLVMLQSPIGYLVVTGSNIALSAQLISSIVHNVIMVESLLNASWYDATAIIPLTSHLNDLASVFSGVSVVHFMASLNEHCSKISPFVDALCTRYPSVNFLKVGSPSPYLISFSQVCFYHFLLHVNI